MLRFAARALRYATRRVIGHRGKKIFWHFYAFQSILSRLRHTFFFENFREFRATREARNGSKGVKFFFAFLRVSEHFESIETHFFFSKIFVSAKREMRASKASEMRAQGAKPEGAKRPSSPAGLAGRSAERACQLVTSL